MNTLILEAEPLALHVEVTEEFLQISLVDGRILRIPLEWYPRLQHATPKERDNWQLLADGYAIEWADIDEHIGIEGLIAGRRSGESARSLEKWLSGRKTSGS